jgi:hypothetical protein
MSIRIGCSDVVNGLNKSNSGRVCEKMSCEESKVYGYICRYPP